MPPPLRTLPGDYHFYAYSNNAATPWTPGTPQPGRGGLAFYSMEQDLTSLANWGNVQGVPNIALRRVQVNNGGPRRDLLVLELGGAAGVAAANDPAAVITGGIHAREWVAPAMAYLLAEYLVRNYDAAAVAPKAVALRNLIDSRRIIFAPMLNPIGNSYTVYSTDAGARMWRKNRRVLPDTTPGWALLIAGPNPPLTNINVPPPAGTDLARYTVPVYRGGGTTTNVSVPAASGVGVDLNRNCSTPAWANADGSSGLPHDDDYFGPRVQSEPETLSIQLELANAAAAAGGLATSVDYHSFAKLILYPSEAADGGLVGAQYTALGEILQKLIGPWNEPLWSWDYGLGTPRERIGYDAVGTLGDRSAISHGARAFVIELDPGRNDDPPGFQLPENQIQNVFEKNLRGALALIAAGASVVNNTRNWVGYGNRTITSAEGQFLAWNVSGCGNQLPP